jgi:hypothetical protein
MISCYIFVYFNSFYIDPPSPPSGDNAAGNSEKNSGSNSSSGSVSGGNQGEAANQLVSPYGEDAPRISPLLVLPVNRHPVFPGFMVRA